MAPIPPIGFDLGSSNLCVATFQDGHPVVIPNQFGNKTTPAYIAFADAGRLIGEPAKVQAGFNPCNTICETKRILGRRWGDPLVQRLINFWPFEVREGGNGSNSVVINCKHKGINLQLSPEEISALLLGKLKEVAELYTNHPCTRAVLSAPANFTDSQRQATYDAARITGIEVTLVSEPAAAALAYGHQWRGNKEPRTVLVYDFGGGYLDVSVVTIQETKIQVLASAGDANLGGDDFDLELVSYFAAEFRGQNNADLGMFVAALRNLKMACEKAKRILSTNTDAFVVMTDSQHFICGFCRRISRAQFEVICAHLFRAAMRPVHEVLELAGLAKDQIDDIICIGSNTKIPKIRHQLEEFFGKFISQAVNPDEGVAMGAAIMGAILEGQVGDLELLEVVPFAVGVGIGGGRVEHVIDRCEKLPITGTRIFTTDVDNQTEIQVDVYEGNGLTTEECHLMGTFVIPGLKSAPQGQIQVPVVFTVDMNGILSVRISDNLLSVAKGRLTPGEIDNKLVDAKNFATIEDEMRKGLEGSRLRLEDYLVRAQNLVGKAEAGVLSPADEQTLSLACIQACRWLHKESHSDADYELRLNQLKKEIEPLLTLITTMSGPSIDNK